MPTFTITDRSRKHSKTESFLDNTISIKSHSGLHPAECSLIDNLKELKSSGNLLIAGNRTGAVAMAASAIFPDCGITSHAYDIHHAAAIIRNLKGNSFEVEFVTDEYVRCKGTEAGAPPEEEYTGEEKGQMDSKDVDCPEPIKVVPPINQSNIFTVACTSCIAENSFDNALYMITPNTSTGELALNLLEDIHKALKVNGRCLITYDGECGSFMNQMKSVFTNIRVLKQRRKEAIFLCTKKSALKKPRNFTAEFEASLPGTERIKLISLPGVFSHRRPDKGGLALAEITAPLVKPGMSVMDFGCGCGMVGALLALKEPDIKLTFIDSSIRAIDSTHRNIEALGLKNTQLILSDTGTTENGFDIFAGNPPYYSDYRIAELFIDQAYESLKPGGTALIVTKQTNKIEELVYECFGNTDDVPRRGYSVISAVK